MDSLKGKGVELSAIAFTCIVNLIIGSYQYGKLEGRVATLEQLRSEARAEVSGQLADIKGQLAETNRKLDRVLERR